MIRGFFDVHRGPHPWVTAGVLLSGYSQQWVPVDFLVDTGAATTCLHPNDAILRVGISPLRLALPQMWARKSGRHGVGGSGQYYTVDASYAFLHDSTNELQVIQGTVDIAQMTPRNETLPSLLGWDILRYFKITVDSKAGTVILE